MAGALPGESSHYGNSESGPSRSSQDRPEEGGRWYFSRKEIEENSPSRRDKIDLKKETYLRKSYCTFLQDLGMRLKVPQVTIATAIIFCHRFFIRQSHAKNDRRVVYEQQKELILLGERVVLATLGFDLNVHHPYKPLVEAIKKFKVAQNALAQVAWNFVNDGLRTSLCLQFKTHHIAAGAIFLAAKFLKVKLPSDGEKVWWQEFDVTPRQLEEVSNQMLELYEQNRVPPSQGSEVEGSAGGGSGHRLPAKTPGEDHVSKLTSSQAASEPLCQDDNVAPPRNAHNQNNDNGSGETDSVITDHKVEVETTDCEHFSHKEITRDDPNKSRYGAEQLGEEDQERTAGRNDGADAGEWRDDAVSHKSTSLGGRNLDLREGLVDQSPKDAIKMIDKDKLKAALEKRKKSRGETTWKKDIMDEDDLIERELEDGVELAAENEKIKQERRQSWSKTENPDYINDYAEIGDGNHVIMKGQSSCGAEYAEEGEMLNDASPILNDRKRKGSPAERQSDGKRRHDYNRDTMEDGHKMGKSGHAEREHRRHPQDNYL